MSEPRAWKCECGAKHEFGVYVMAHWDETLVHTCQSCGRKHNVRRGLVTLIKPTKAKNKESRK